MRSTLLGLGLVLAALAVALTIWTRAPGEDAPTPALLARSPETTPRASEAGGELAPAGARAPAPDRRATATEPDAVEESAVASTTRVAAAHAAKNARIVGRCVDESGGGIEGVQLREDRGGGSTKTDGEGRFALELDTGQAASCTFRLHLSRGGYGTTSFEALAKASATVDLGDIVLRLAGRVLGQVVDAAGNPLPDATVQVEEALSEVEGSRFEGADRPLATGQTDAEGAFRIDDVPPGVVRVWAGARGMQWATSDAVEVHSLDDSAGVVLQLFPLDPEDTIELLVLDPAGAPVPRAQVQYRYQAGGSSGSGTMSADEQGRCRRFVLMRAPHSFLASDPEEAFRPAFANDVVPGTHDLVLQLGERMTFDLRVRDQAKQPVERYEATLSDVDDLFRHARAPRGELRPEGSCEMVLPVVPFELTVEADGYEIETLGPVDPVGTLGTVDVRLSPLPGVSGRVTADGAPVVRAQVGLHEAIDSRTSYVVNGFPCRSNGGPTARGETDEDGNFRLTLRTEGSFFLRVDAAGYATGERGPLELDPAVAATNLDVELCRGGAIEGRVLVAPGEDRSGVIVGLSRADGHGITRRTDAEGRFSFEGLAPGRWLVRAMAKEIRSGSTTSSRNTTEREQEIPWSCEVRDGQTTTYDLDIRVQPATLVGRFTIDGEAPGTGWRALLDADDSIGSTAVAVDSGGRFELGLDTLGSAELRLERSLSGQIELTVGENIELIPGENRWEYDLEIGRVEGRLAAAHMSARASVFYFSDGEDGHFVRARVVPEPDGRFEVPMAAVGKGHLFADSPDGTQLKTDVEVPRGGTVQATLP